MEKHHNSINRIVVKVGTSVVTDDAGVLNRACMQDIARQISGLMKRGIEVILVSSGAIGSGVRELGLHGTPRDVPTRQGAAAIGQSILMEAWRKEFKRYGLKVAQILLTYESFSNRTNYLNLKNTINALMKYNTVAIINENDPISIYEITETFGDNDKLSALVAVNAEADLLVILTDVDGLYDKNPRHSDARLIKVVEEITPEIEIKGGSASSWRTRGGMKTKIEAAKITMRTGCDMVIANAKERDAVTRIVDGEGIGTLFKASESGYKRKEKWMMCSQCHGKVEVDWGAREALLKRKSLLPSGVVKVEGEFDAGSMISVTCEGEEFGRGVVEYSSAELQTIKGLQTCMVEKVLGRKGCNSVIRKENIVHFYT